MRSLGPSQTLRRAALAAALVIALPLAARADRGDENMTGQRELQMASCPSAVAGAVTRVTDLRDGVVVAVHAPLDVTAQLEIKRRVQKQLELVDRLERGAIEHTGLGTGSGRYGFCPGMLEHTSMSVQWTTDGAIMTIKPDRAGDVRHLQSITHRRARWLAARLHATAAR